jgi:hypothetical protein
MSWGAQNRFEDAKTPSGSRGRSDKPEPDRCPIQPYAPSLLAGAPILMLESTITLLATAIIMLSTFKHQNR